MRLSLRSLRTEQYPCSIRIEYRYNICGIDLWRRVNGNGCDVNKYGTAKEKARPVALMNSGSRDTLTSVKLQVRALTGGTVLVLYFVQRGICTVPTSTVQYLVINVRYCMY